MYVIAHTLFVRALYGIFRLWALLGLDRNMNTLATSDNRYSSTLSHFSLVAVSSTSSRMLYLLHSCSRRLLGKPDSMSNFITAKTDSSSL